MLNAIEVLYKRNFKIPTFQKTMLLNFEDSNVYDHQINTDVFVLPIIVKHIRQKLLSMLLFMTSASFEVNRNQTRSYRYAKNTAALTLPSQRREQFRMFKSAIKTRRMIAVNIQQV